MALAPIAPGETSSKSSRLVYVTDQAFHANLDSANKNVLERYAVF